MRDDTRYILRRTLNEYLDRNDCIDYSSLYEIFGLSQDELVKILCGRLEIREIDYYTCIDKDSKIEFTITESPIIYNPMTFEPQKRMIFRWRKINQIGYYDIEKQYSDLININIW